VVSVPIKSQKIYYFRLAENGWKTYFYEYKTLPVDTVFILKQKEEIFKPKLYNLKTRGCFIGKSLELASKIKFHILR